MHTQMYYHEPKSSWKPGWSSMRHQADIKQDQPRLEQTVVKEKREAAIKELKAERVHRW